jgi:hypothetical protein
MKLMPAKDMTPTGSWPDFLPAVVDKLLDLASGVPGTSIANGGFNGAFLPPAIFELHFPGGVPYVLVDFPDEPIQGTHAQIAAIRGRQDAHKAQELALQTFYVWVKDSCTDAVLELFRHPVTRTLTTLRIGSIYAILHAKFGVVTAKDHAQSMRQLSLPHDFARTSVEQTVQLFQRVIARAADANQTITSVDKIDLFLASIRNGGGLPVAVEDWRKQQAHVPGMPTDDTFTELCAFMVARDELRLSDAIATAGAYGFAGQVHVDDDGGGKLSRCYEESAEFRAAVERRAEQLAAERYGVALAATTAPRAASPGRNPTPPRPPALYCCSHGLCFHLSKNCEKRSWPKHDNAITIKNWKLYPESAQPIVGGRGGIPHPVLPPARGPGGGGAAARF